MGNFYTNLVLPSADEKRVVAALESHKRTAYVATDGGRTFVFDDECEKQDPAVSLALASALSKAVGTPVLACINHDDDVLWLGLAEHGLAKKIYESNPAFEDGGWADPEINDLPRLCAIFGVEHHAREIEELLSADRDKFTFEVVRHEHLLGLLGVSRLGLTGFNYLYEEGIQEPGVTVHTIGDATPPEQMAEDAPASPSSPASLDLPPEIMERAKEQQILLTALMLGEARIPAGVEAILPEGRVGGMVALQKVQMYIASHGLMAMGQKGAQARADDTLRRLFGVDEFAIQDVNRLIVERLDVWSSFSPQDAADIKAGKPVLKERQGDAMKGLRDLFKGMFGS